MILADIVRRLKRSLNDVLRFRKIIVACNAKMRVGGPPKLFPQDRRRIKRKLARNDSSCMQLKQCLRKDVSKSTSWREIKSQNLFRYKKRNHALMMTSRHRAHCVHSVVERAHWTTKRHEFVCSDERKHKLHGPDSTQYGWHDLRKERQNYFFRHYGGVQLWSGMLFLKSRTEREILDERKTAQNSRATLKFLCCHLLTHFMQKRFLCKNGASIPTARIFHDWFQALNIISPV